MDTLEDVFAYLGNSKEGVNSTDGMTVFGFGRDTNSKPKLTGKNSFIIGFFDKSITTAKSHKFIESHISRLIEKRQ